MCLVSTCDQTPSWFVLYVRQVYVLRVSFAFNMASYLVDSYKKKKKLSIHNSCKINSDCDGADFKQVHQHFITFTNKYFRLENKLAEEHLYHHNLCKTIYTGDLCVHAAQEH